MLHLAQIRNADGTRAVVAITEGGAAVVPGFASTYALAGAAIRAGRSLAAEVAAAGSGAAVDVEAALAERRVLAPIDHPDPAHLLVTGTGLTHLGCAEGRDKMHKDLADPREAHRLHEDVPHGARRRQAARRRDAACSRNGSTRATAHRGRRRSSRSPSPAFALGRRRGAGDRRHLRDRRRTARRSASASRSATSSPTTSRSGRTISTSPIRSCGRARSGRSCCSARCPATCAARRASGATARWSGRSRFLSGEDNMSHTHRQPRAAPLQVCAVPPAGRRARPFLRHGDAVLRRRLRDPSPATSSRSWQPPFGCRCAIRSSAAERRSRISPQL